MSFKPRKHFRKRSYVVMMQVIVSLCNIAEDWIDKKSAKSQSSIYNLNLYFKNLYFPL